MKRLLSCLVVVLALLSLAGSVQAQVPFHAMFPPQDHWAFEAVISLEKDGILIGDPDGRFHGERALTRYEFAVAMKRALDSIAATPRIARPIGDPGEKSPIVKQVSFVHSNDDFNKTLKDYLTLPLR